MNQSPTPGQFGHPSRSGDYLREREIVHMLAIARSTFRSYIAQGRVSRGILLSPGVRVWARSEIVAFVEACS